jgi:hypothetical protein
MTWCNVYFHFVVVIYLVICITMIFLTLCTPRMQWYRGSSFNMCKWHLRPFFILSWKMHILRGSSTIQLNSRWFMVLLLSLNCVVINHQKGGDWKCIWPLKWVLVLMISIIKDLMCSSNYGQVKIQWNEIFAWKDANLLDRWWWSSKEDLYLVCILNLSIENTVLLREMRMDSLKTSKCLIEMLTTQERYKITHLYTLFSHRLSVCQKFQPRVRSSDHYRKLLDSSDRGSSAGCF